MTDRAKARRSKTDNVAARRQFEAMAAPRTGLLRANMTMPFDCHFAQRIVGRSTLSDPLMQAPVPRSVAISEPAILDGAGGGNRTHTPCGTGF
jgi:hypothetical protein